MVRTALGRYALLTLALAAFVTHPSVTRANEDGTESSIPIRFVVVTTFDTGGDIGTAPGEFNTWVANFPLPSIDPNVGPAGSAAWASYVIDGDLAYEIDAREITVRLEHGLCSARTLIRLSTAGAACELDQRRKPVPAQRALRQLGLSVQPCQRCTSGYQQSADPSAHCTRRFRPPNLHRRC
jgi:Purine nucleoside permease (NUP)